MDDNNNFNLSQLSFREFDNSFFTSTPSKKKSVTPRKVGVAKSRALLKTKATFAVPSTTPLYRCPHCPNNKPYKTQRYFKQHMMIHSVQDAYSKFPDFNSLLTSSTVISERVMKRISNLVLLGSTGQQYAALLSKLKENYDGQHWKDFHESVNRFFATAVNEKRFILPSALWSLIFVELERILSSSSVRSSLQDLISSATSIHDSDIIQLLICDFTLFCAEEILSFIRETVVTTTLHQSVISLDKEDRQTIHYIGGSIIHHFRKRGRKSSGNKEWQLILHVIATRMIEGDPQVQPASDEDKEWTTDVNRGGLLLIGAKCMNMFVAITAVLCKIVEPNGTVILEKVFTAIYDSPLPAIWDDLVGPDIDESLSLNFMNGVVRSYSQTFGRGLVAMKLNSMNDKPYVSISLRHKVAPKA